MLGIIVINVVLAIAFSIIWANGIEKVKKEEDFDVRHWIAGGPEDHR